MKIVDIQQRSNEWYEFRSEGIGASESAKVLGLSKWGNQRDVYLDKKGLSPATFINDNIIRGMELEDSILEYAEFVLDKTFYPICAIHDKFNFMRASFDGISSDNKMIVECKAPRVMPSDESLSNFKENYPDYFCQLQHQYAVSGAEKAYMAFRVEDDFKLFEVKRDDDFINNELIPALSDFWLNHILLDTEPAALKYDQLLIDDQEALKIAKALKDTIEKRKELEESEKFLRKQLEDFGDDGDLVFGNILKMTRSSRKTVDYKKIISDHNIDITSYTKESIGSYRITLIKE